MSMSFFFVHIKVHDFEYASDLMQIVNETLPALKELQEKGKVRYIGINTYSLEKLKYKCVFKFFLAQLTNIKASHLKRAIGNISR